MEPTRSPVRLFAVRPRGPQPAALLGAGHPLARAYERFALVGRQALIVAVLGAAGLGALAEGVAWAPALVGGAVATLAALGLVAAGLYASRRIEARELIVAGGEHVALAVVERERRRLLSARTRLSLAASLAAMLHEATRSPSGGARLLAPPLFEAAVVCAVADDARAIAALVRAELSEARGIALLETLMRRGGSPLYGGRVAPLRAELRRVRFLLEDQRPEAPPDVRRHPHPTGRGLVEP